MRTVAAGTTTVDFDGLDAGTAYTFRARANSDVGFGRNRSRAARSRPPTHRRRRINLSAGPGAVPGSVAFDWDEPATDGGVPIESYEAASSAGPASGCRDPTDAELLGRRRLTPLTFEVTARNEAAL